MWKTISRINIIITRIYIQHGNNRINFSILHFDSQCYFIQKVLPNDIDDVAKEILAGVEEALLYKKKQYVSTNVQNLQKFSLEVNFVIQ